VNKIINSLFLLSWAAINRLPFEMGWPLLQDKFGKINNSNFFGKP